MKNVMKISRNDPFDQIISTRAFGVLVTWMYSDLCDYIYYLTFKRSMKSYQYEFDDVDLKPIIEMDFFLTIDDLFVQNCLKAHNRLVECKFELVLRFGLDEEGDLLNEDIRLEARRYIPYMLLYKRSKSYKRLKLYYERSLTEIIQSLYLYACAFTAKSYKIPLVLKRQFKLDDSYCFRLLNAEDNTVEFLTDLMTGLKQDLKDLRVLMKK